MGIFTSAGEFMDKGTAGLNRGAHKVSVKARLAELERRRERACTRLGTEVFAQTADDAAMRAPFEQLYAEIEALDSERAALEEDLARTEAERQAAGEVGEEAAAESADGQAEDAERFRADEAQEQPEPADGTSTEETGR